MVSDYLNRTLHTPHCLRLHELIDEWGERLIAGWE